MNFIDALVVTFLGVSVVFTGLILTYLIIVAIIQIPVLAEKLKRPKTVLAPQPEGKTAAETQTPVSAEKMAVIATVLEVELRLRNSMANTRFTFRRS